MRDLSSWVEVTNTAGSVVVVLLFIWFLRKERESCDKLEKARFEALKHIGDQCHAHSLLLTEMTLTTNEKLGAIITDNTKALGRIERLYDSNPARQATEHQ